MLQELSVKKINHFALTKNFARNRNQTGEHYNYSLFTITAFNFVYFKIRIVVHPLYFLLKSHRYLLTETGMTSVIGQYFIAPQQL